MTCSQCHSSKESAVGFGPGSLSKTHTCISCDSHTHPCAHNSAAQRHTDTQQHMQIAAQSSKDTQMGSVCVFAWRVHTDSLAKDTAGNTTQIQAAVVCSKYGHTQIYTPRLKRKHSKTMIPASPTTVCMFLFVSPTHPHTPSYPHTVQVMQGQKQAEVTIQPFPRGTKRLTQGPRAQVWTLQPVQRPCPPTSRPAAFFPVPTVLNS